ncbi:MAG: FAD-dependent oxidoreductase [Dokdonella sp.]
MPNSYATWALAVVIILLLAAIVKIVMRTVRNGEIYLGHKRPAKFDFNLIVIGAGSAGLVSAYIAAMGRAKVALIERDKMGGDCLNTGCVPSKALLRTARLVAEARHAERFGIAKVETEIDFAQVMKRVHEVIGKIAPHDSVERYTELGVNVIKGEAKLVSPWEVVVGNKRMSARSIVIATGAGPLVPKIEGIDSVDYLTSDNLWDLTVLPKRLVVLGGGPIGCEMTQAFARLGSKVTQVEMAARLLPREDADAATEVQKAFNDDGVTVMTQCRALRVEAGGEGGRLICEHGGKEISLPFDRLLLALGRKARVEGFGLKELGVELTERGTVHANKMLQTNFPNIFVAGDAVGPYQFTHVASHQAWYASINALAAPFWSFNVDYRVIPWATFTEPEVARVGLSEDEAEERGIDVEVTRYKLDDLDRAIVDSADNGFVKVLTKPGKDEILGALIVGKHSADLLAEFVLAMKHGLGLNKILGTIHTYPTMSEANKYVAGNWKREHAPERLLRIAKKFFDWRRG